MDKYYDNIKNYLVYNEVYKKVKDYSKNKSDLETYYNVGKELVLAGKHYGEGIIKNYSVKLTNELGKGYTYTSLTRMKKFYNLIEKVATLSQQLTYGHYVELLSYNDINKINYYIQISIDHNLSVRELRKRVKLNEYERLPIETKNKIINKKESKIQDLVKDPILIKNKNNIENISEKILQQLILEDITSFMKELGEGFSFIGNEYKIKIGDRNNYIDLLFFNIEYNCYVVVELKITELKKEHIGQVNLYMNYIDENIKKENQNKTIGIIICKKNNQFIIEYCSDKRIITREYELV